MSQYSSKNELILGSLSFYFSMVGIIYILTLLSGIEGILQLGLILIGAQISGMCLMFYDKLNSVKGGVRVPEVALFMVALFFGSPGILVSLNLFRHKRQKDSFLAKIACILILQIIVGILFISRL